MAKYALFTEDTVTSIQDLTDEQVDALAGTHPLIVDITNKNPMPAIGWKWNGSNIVPGEGMSATPEMKITKLAMRRRFTTAELLAIYDAMATNPVVRLLMDDMTVSTYIDLTRTDTQQGIGYLAQIGLITSQRMTAILTTIPSPTEAYK